MSGTSCLPHCAQLGGAHGDPLPRSLPGRDIQDRSIIKIYRKEPLYAAFPGSHLTNGDLRVCLGAHRALVRLDRWNLGRTRTFSEMGT